jgi:hypothetical protein
MIHCRRNIFQQEIIQNFGCVDGILFFYMTKLEQQYNIKVVLKETGCEIDEWIRLAKARGQWLALTDI